METDEAILTDSTLRPCGRDRVRLLENGTVLLSSRYEKGWHSRKGKTSTHSEHPGTAVLWQDQYFEVIAMEPAQGGVRYVLQPWSEQHTFRTFEVYDEDAESRREAGRRDVSSRERKRHVSLLLSVFLGHLPAEAQERLHNEIGLAPILPTVVSAIPMLAIGAFCTVSLFVLRFAPGALVIPVPLLLFGVYLFGESVLRLGMAAARQPTGSLLGSLVYLCIPRKHKPKQKKRLAFEVPSDVEQSDAYQVREPFLALLPAKDQQRLTERFGFDSVRWGRRTALTLLAVSGIGFATAALAVGGGVRTFSNYASLLVALAVAVEQITRLISLSRGRPAGSVLGIVVRPLVRRLL